MQNDPKIQASIRVANLIHRYFGEGLDAGEQQELNKWLDADTANRELFEQLSDEQERDLWLRQLQAYDLEEGMEAIKRKISIRKLRYQQLLPYAAAVLLCMAVGIGIYRIGQKRPVAQNQLTSQYGDDVLPGGQRATLTLSDGKTIDLDSAASGLLAEQQGITITKKEDGLVTYEVQTGGLDTVATAFNTITTPNGGQYQVILPDSTKVWLNAASSLRYPATFAASERKVELTGEGYFEVARNEQQPFIVVSGGQSIQVLGTEFNINAYLNEPAITTTLINGSIRIRQEALNKSEVLSPGQQAVLSDGIFRVNKVNVEEYVAWKNGLIILHQAGLPAIIRQIERWYDVTFDRFDLTSDVTLSGELPHDVRLSQVLKALEINTGLQFKIEGRRVRVSK